MNDDFFNGLTFGEDVALTLEQELADRIYSEQINQCSEAESKSLLIQAVRLLMMQNNVIKTLEKKRQ